LKSITFSLAPCLLLLACAANDAARIESQVDLYARYVREGNHFGIASLFASFGKYEQTGQPTIQGSKEIQRYLVQTQTLKVREFSLDLPAPKINNGQAQQSGLFQQQLQTAQGRVTEITGKIEIDWVQSDNGRWLINRLRLTTASAPTQ